MIEDFQHACVSCTDIGRSLRFYEMLGLSAGKGVTDVKDESIARAFGLSKIHLKVAHLTPLTATDGMFIDLVEWRDPAQTGVPYSVQHHIGITRLAFRVADVNAIAIALRGKGVKFLSEEPQNFGPDFRGIVATDPDGICIQFLERVQH